MQPESPIEQLHLGSQGRALWCSMGTLVSAGEDCASSTIRERYDAVPSTHLQEDAPLCCVLQGVGEAVGQDLLDPKGVHQHLLGHLWGDPLHQGHALARHGLVAHHQLRHQL